MKFGQSLADHMVPEWRDQYLNYKLGKKKLKKLSKKPSVLQSINEGSYEGPIETPLIDEHDHSINTESHKFNALEHQNTLGSMASEGSYVPHSSPLHMPKRSSVKLSDTRNASETQSHRRSSKGSIPVLKRFVSRAGSNSDSPLLQSDTELEDMSGYAREQFWSWVNEELNKVEMFYDEREYACIERFLILQDQIHQLEEQKLRSRRRWIQVKKMKRDNASGGNSMNPVVSSTDANVNDEFDDEYADDIEIDLEADIIKRNLKFWSFWTKRKLRIIRKFDIPSLPSFEWLKSNGKIEKQYYEEGYELKKKSQNGIPYFVAKKMLKKAIYELYRAMELLKSYRLLNRTAFRKLIKKYDKATGDTTLADYMKKVDELHFVKSDVLDNLINNIEELYTSHFENGNRKVAVTKLRSNPQEQTFYAANYLSGLNIGMGLPLVVYAMYLGLHFTLSGKLIHGEYLLQIWGGFFVILVMALLFGVNCLVWTKYKVSYKFIFEFNQHDALDYKQYMLIPSVLFFFLGLIAWFSFEDFWDKEFIGRDFPWIFLVVCAAIIVCPFDIFYLNARLWLVSSMMRLLLSGFYPVEFRDFFLGDIFCSLTYSISNLSTFFCLYACHWTDVAHCGSSQSRLLGFLQCVPSIWRFLQCFRRWADTGDWFPHLANMGKYTVSTLYYVSLSLYRIERAQHYKILLIFWATFNSVFSSIWDILMDWSLFQFDSENFLLRDELAFGNPYFYYFAMVIDVILRFQWVFYVLFPNNIQQSAITSFLIAIAEVVRRFIWIFFRMENEHATNVHLFRASRDSPLPYPKIERPPRSSDIIYQGIPLPEPVESNIDLMGSNGLRRASTAVEPLVAHEERKQGLVRRYLTYVSQTVRNAHIKDFQRRKVEDVPEDEGHSDDDDEDDDDE